MQRKSNHSSWIVWEVKVCKYDSVSSYVELRFRCSHHFRILSAALSATVDIFYERMIVDEQLAKFFEGISLTRLKLHQTKFLTMAFTEIPTDIDVVAYIIDKHSRLFQNLGLDGSHFDLVAGHLVAALQQLNVPENLIAEVVAIVGPLRGIFADEAERIKNENK